MAEEEGFEPPEPCGSTVFKTAALNHSATPPEGTDKHTTGELADRGGFEPPVRL
jgi:hypothetical protein